MRNNANEWVIALYYARPNEKHNRCPQGEEKKAFMNTITNISNAYI